MPYYLLMMMAGSKLKEIGILEHNAIITISKKLVFSAILLVVLVASALINESANLSVGYMGKSVTLMYLSHVSASILLMMLMELLDRKAKAITSFLAKIGKRTLFILCYHYFILQFLTSVILRKLSIHWLLIGGLKGSNAQKEELVRHIIVVEKLAIILITIAICVGLDVLVEKLLKKKNK